MSVSVPWGSSFIPRQTSVVDIGGTSATVGDNLDVCSVVGEVGVEKYAGLWPA